MPHDGAMGILSLPVRIALAPFRKRPPVVGVVRLGGIIGGFGPLRRGLALSGVARSLERAFSLSGVEAVALAINSPGGSAVQAALIHGRIRALATEKEVKVFAFAEDVAASGGYWLALAADEIFADEASIVGSIGVISAGFGFAQAAERLGIERRLHTAGDKKSMLDPFRPEDPDDVARLTEIQGDIHESFKRLVRERREGRLAGADDEVFSGAFWTGRRALDLGLIDRIGDLRSVMRERYGENVKLKLIGEDRRWPWRRFGPSSDSPGAPGEWAAGVLGALEARSLWSRYGL
jgi:signal peptide peptidase SppA